MSPRIRSFQSPACFLHEMESQPKAKRASLISRSQTGSARKTARAMRASRGVCIKRIYDAPSASDGYRILVDRLWPRGVRKQDATIDEWAKDIAPSPQLRKWFAHDPERFEEFARRYRAELQRKTAELRPVRERAAKGRVTLLYAAKDPLINHAAVLAEFLAR